MKEPSRDEPPRAMDTVGGPYFEELHRGQVFDTAPAVTLNVGHAMVHQSIVGDRLRLPLDEQMAAAVTGRAPFAHPALVWDLAVGQSTLATHHVAANLFYRGLTFHHAPHLGDTLRTTTEVVGLRQNQPKAGRPPTGLAVLRVTTTDQDETCVLDFWRCAMLPLGDPTLDTGAADDLDEFGTRSPDARTVPWEAWSLAEFRRWVGGEHWHQDWSGRTWTVSGGDVVSNAPELARLTLNIAKIHHDATGAGSQRLVYGGHTIGIALAQACRAIPNIVTVTHWDRCDHTGPVHEGDTLHSRLTAEASTPVAGGSGLVHLRSQVRATPTNPDLPPRDVLDWRFSVLLA